MCWDCLEILPKIEWNYIIVTDPPFNIGYHYNHYADDLSEWDYYERLWDVFWNKSFVCIHYPEPLYKLSFQIWQFPEKVVSWVYNSNTAKQHRDIAFFWVKPDFKKLWQPYKNPTDKRIAKRIEDWKQARWYDRWNINQVKNVSKDKTSHPCQMPLEVMENIIRLLPKDKLIVDPFCWSWTTAVACKKLWRNFIGIDISQEYVDITNERLKNTEMSLFPTLIDEGTQVPTWTT